MNVRLAVAAGAVVAVGAAAVSYVHGHSALAAGGALLAGALAAALGWFVTTLPGLTLRGLLTGGFFVLAGMLSWTYLEHGSVVWAVLAVEGVAFAVWSWPWLPHLSTLPRLGTAGLGLAYWLLGIAGALLIGKLTVAGQRVAYAGVFTLAVLAIVASTRRSRERARDLSVGIVGAFILAIAALFLSGSGNLFESVHVVPAGGWGHSMEYRFWGGHWLLYHPNSLAAIGVLVAIRVGPDRAFALWQRIAVTVLAGFVLWETNSRTGLIYFGAAAVVHAFLLWRHRGAGLPEYRRLWVAAAVPFAVLALVFTLSATSLLRNRYSADDPTSGRLDTWKQVGVEWVHAGWAERLFGDAQTSRAVVKRADDGTAATGDKQLNLTTDNAAVGALRRGGLLGEAAFLVGLGLLLWHAVQGRRSPRRRDRAPRDPAPRDPAPRDPDVGQPPAWLTIAAVGALPTIATSDWLLGGTGGTLWVLLVAGEAWLLFAPVREPAQTAALSEP